MAACWGRAAGDSVVDGAASVGVVAAGAAGAGVAGVAGLVLKLASRRFRGLEGVHCGLWRLREFGGEPAADEDAVPLRTWAR